MGKRGVVDAEWNIAQFVSGNKIEIQPFFVGRKIKAVPSKLQFFVDEVVHFGNNEPIEPNLTKKRRLYIPLDQSFQGWDCIYDDGHKTIFFSFSISHIWEGNPSHVTQIENTFKIEENGNQKTKS